MNFILWIVLLTFSFTGDATRVHVDATQKESMSRSSGNWAIERAGRPCPRGPRKLRNQGIECID